MSNSAKIIKSVMKKNVGEKPTFGTDPRDPWSTKANINEDAVLDRYLLSRGINPKFATKDQKVAHSKTGQYLKWRRDRANQIGEDTVEEGMTLQHTPTEKRQHALKRAEHMHKEIRVDGHGKNLHSEAVDKKDTITMNIPLLIRMLEYAREDAKTDLSLHKVVEKLIAIRNRGVLTMKEYNFVTGIREHFELTEQECSCVPKDKKEWEKFAQKRSEIWRQKQVKKIDEALEDLEESLADMVLGAAKDAGLKATVAKSSAERKKDTEDMLKKRAASDKAAGIKRPLGGLYSKEYHPKANEEVERLDEIGDTKKGQKLLQMVNKRAVSRVTSKRADTDPTYAKKAQQTHWSADERLKEEQVVEGSAALRFAKALQKAKQERELKDQSREAREKQQTPAPVKEEEIKAGDFVQDVVHGHTHRVHDVQGNNLVVNRHHGKDSYGGFTNLHVTKAKKVAAPVNENMDSMAACAQPGDGANTPNDVIPKSQRSKSARIIKSIYKNKGMKEEVLDETWKYHTYSSKEEANSARNAHHAWRDDNGKASGNPARLMPGNKVAYKGEFKGPKPMKEEIYDHEKEDKSTTGLKKPKIDRGEGKASFGDDKPKAAIVMTGGKTMTGSPRDTIEIDPLMKAKPGGPNDPTTKK